MENESNLPQETTTLENISEQHEQKITPEPIFTFPPIAGFWRRFFAFLIDSLILGVIGQIFGAVFSSFLFSFGPYGRPIGLLFIIPYFGIMNSKIGGGQTIGKRLLRIAVRDKNNESIGLGRSMVRILLLAIPTLLNGWAIPIFQNDVMAWFSSLLIFGLGGAILYTMIFNRKARQGIHDLLLGTYVVHLSEKRIETLPTTDRIHWVIASIWIGIVAIGTLVATLIVPSLISKSPLASVTSLYNVLQNDPRFFTVGVNDNTSYGSNGKTSHALIITVWYKGQLAENDMKSVFESVAKTVLENAKNINDYDGIQIKIASSYDIGIASGTITKSYGNSIKNWREEIYPNGSPNGLVSPLKKFVLVFP